MNIDYIIVGAGSAGCVLANRLSADPRKRVVLLEAGPASRNPWLRVPAGMVKLFSHATLNWRYSTEPEPELRGRRLYWPRGKTLGGSSAINGMGYVRGNPADYDQWRQLGCVGWDWDGVLPYFRAIERREGPPDPWHGSDGDLSVAAPRTHHPVSFRFLESANAVGIPSTDDFNGERQEGAGFYEFSIDRGLRHSSANAFLDPIRNRSNLTIVCEAHAECLLFDGRRATGVRYRQDGKSIDVRARQVIVSGGAVNSPHLLMVSGIGPGADLRSKGIGVVIDAPGVGRNLQDHLYVHHLSRVRAGWSSNDALRWPGLIREVADYAFRRRGALALGASQAGAFLRSDDRLDRPDLQLMFKAYSLGFGPTGQIVPSTIPGVTTSISQVRPLSRGRIELASADPFEAPRIHANYLSEGADVNAMVTGLRWVRRIFSAAPIADIVEAEEAPGAARQSDADLLDFIRDQAQSMYHPVGTCHMGGNPDSVVDSRLRVRGIDGLRVADASIMPTIIAGNTNAPSIMIGAKASAMILEDDPG